MTTGDDAFDARLEVLSVDPADVPRVLAPDIRRRLLELDDVAELRVDDGAASLHLTYTKLDHEPIRQGIELVVALG